MTDAAIEAQATVKKPMRFRETRRLTRTYSRSFSSMLGPFLVILFLFIAAFDQWLDIFLSIPGPILAIAIVGALGPGILNAMIALSLMWWPCYVRLVQAKTLSQRNETYADAARALGAGPMRVVFVHVLLNCLSSTDSLFSVA